MLMKWAMTKKQMVEICSMMNITVPEGATTNRLRTLIAEFFNTAAIVKTKDGVSLVKTNKPTSKYKIKYNISGCHSVEAESKEAAREWVEDQIFVFGHVGDEFGEENDFTYEVLNCGMEED